MKSALATTALVAVLVSCGPPKPGDESSETPLIETQCAAFCERAITCESEEFAAEWGFTTQAECQESCLTFTQYMVDHHTLPACETILGDEWECAGSIEECRIFRDYEDSAFGMAAPSNPCLEETFEAFDHCN